MKFFLVSNCSDIVCFAIASGVDRIFIDTEVLGKHERQGHLDTVISHHSLDDVKRLRPVVPKGRLLVRINPLHVGSQAEIDRAIVAGADILMLPMFHTSAEVHDFVRFVDGRALTNLLVETPQAAESLQACLAVGGVDEVHIGLNDLHLALGLDFMFQPLVNGLVDRLAQILRDQGVPFGIGGLARVGEGLLPAELILAEHVRLGSSAAILSRTFCHQGSTLAAVRDEMDFPGEILRLRKAYAQYQQADAGVISSIHKDVCARIEQIAAHIRARKGANQTV